MFLDATTKTLEVILSAAKTTNDMSVSVDYVDITATTTTPGEQDSASNGITLVTILAAPAASTQRKVNGLTIYNADTAAKTITVRLNNNTTLRPLVVVTLQVGDTLGYTDTQGWYIQDSTGSLKTTGTVSSASMVSAIHGATDKTTPVGADELGIWDSVTGLLNKVSFTNALNWFAAKLGNSANTFDVSPATASTHATPKSMFDGAAGHIGEYVESVVANISAPTTSTWGDITSISLSAGKWEISIVVQCALSGSTMTAWAGGFSTTSGNSTAGLVAGDTYIDGLIPISTTSDGRSIPGKVVTVASTTTYYLKTTATYSAGTPHIWGRLSAHRIALP